MSITFAKKESIPRVETSRKRGQKSAAALNKMRPDSGVTFPSRNSKYTIIAPVKPATTTSMSAHKITYYDSVNLQKSNRLSRTNMALKLPQNQFPSVDTNQQFSSIQQIAADTGFYKGVSSQGTRLLSKKMEPSVFLLNKQSQKQRNKSKSPKNRSRDRSNKMRTLPALTFDHNLEQLNHFFDDRYVYRTAMLANQ